MKLNGYLEELVGSKVTFRLVRTLLENKEIEFSIRLAAAFAGTSVSEAAEAVRRLERLGVITVRQKGRSHILSLNKKSYVLNSIIKPAIEAEKATFDKLVSILKGCFHGQKVLSAFLYRRVVIRDNYEDSELMMIMISTDKAMLERLSTKVKDEVTRVFNTRLTPFSYPLTESGAMDFFSPRDIRKDYVLIAGKDPRQFVKGK